MTYRAKALPRSPRTEWSTVLIRSPGYTCETRNLHLCDVAMGVACRGGRAQPGVGLSRTD